MTDNRKPGPGPMQTADWLGLALTAGLIALALAWSLGQGAIPAAARPLALTALGVWGLLTLVAVLAIIGTRLRAAVLAALQQPQHQELAAFLGLADTTK
ncbi:MAG: hypothetical protein KKA73_04640 [Chloroflexi bacterium]|nr:hypothetical protein [Chloroflexota bacterium]MBU1746954.1 hypothetical protein [Chloroflexota bacterium]